MPLGSASDMTRPIKPPLPVPRKCKKLRNGHADVGVADRERIDISRI